MSTSETRSDAYFAIISKREIRDYSDQPLSKDMLERILQAGRATGSSRNRQPWRFYVIRDRNMLDRVADMVAEPANIHGCQAAVAIVMTRKRGFDAGRVAQNIGLAAWALGVGSCPNTVMEKEACSAALGLESDWSIATILSLGYPVGPMGPKDDDPDAILERIDRKPLEELTHWVD